jgi:hypothetical protein
MGLFPARLLIIACMVALVEIVLGTPGWSLGI